MRSWMHFQINAERNRAHYRVKDGACYGTTALIGHHLFFFSQDYSEKIWAIDLRDNSVQKKWTSEFRYDENDSLNNYGENQLIKFGSELLLITIDSFDRKTP